MSQRCYWNSIPERNTFKVYINSNLWLFNDIDLTVGSGSARSCPAAKYYADVVQWVWWEVAAFDSASRSVNFPATPHSLSCQWLPVSVSRNSRNVPCTASSAQLHRVPSHLNPLPSQYIMMIYFNINVPSTFVPSSPFSWGYVNIFCELQYWKAANILDSCSTGNC
jgi:hypothetical protein